MKRSLALAALTLGVAVGASPWTAEAAGHASNNSLVRTAFHLQASSNLPPATTFWVAYGPVAGKFGLIRLRRAGNGLFAATGRFPSGVRADFYYIEGHGVIRTKAGLAPGNPVRTVGHAGPLLIGSRPVPLVRLQAPAG